MDIEVTFPGGKRVDARVGSFVLQTDQPVDHGGQGSAVAPFDLFLASLATCAGFYALAFCHARDLPTEGLSLRQHVELDAAGKALESVRIELRLPPSFPAKYRAAIVRAAEGCRVKKALAAPPTIEVIATTEAAGAPNDEPTEQEGRIEHVSTSHV